jgi:hypothetical protein
VGRKLSELAIRAWCFDRCPWMGASGRAAEAETPGRFYAMLRISTMYRKKNERQAQFLCAALCCAVLLFVSKPKKSCGKKKSQMQN